MKIANLSVKNIENEAWKNAQKESYNNLKKEIQLNFIYMIFAIKKLGDL